MTGTERAGHAERSARAVKDVYDEAILEMVRRIGVRLSRGVDQAGWAENKLAQLVRARRELGAAGATLASLPVRTRQLIEEAERLGRAGVQGTNARAIQSLADDLAGAVADANRRVLRWSHDVYRGVIGQAVTLSASGTITTREAAARSIVDFSRRGVTGFVDNSGRPWKLDSYVKMATRTGTMRAHLVGTRDRLRSKKIQLTQVTALAGACRLCDPWEGRVLALDTPTPEHPLTVADAESAGLFHPNCRHNIVAHIPGLTSAPAESDPDPVIRALQDRETAAANRVVESERRLAGARPFGDTTTLRREEALLARRMTDLGSARDRVRRATGG